METRGGAIYCATFYDGVFVESPMPGWENFRIKADNSNRRLYRRYYPSTINTVELVIGSIGAEYCIDEYILPRLLQPSQFRMHWTLLNVVNIQLTRGCGEDVPCMQLDQ